MHWTRFIFLVVCALTWCIIVCSTKPVDDFKFELKPYTIEQWSVLKSLHGKNDSYVFLNDLNSNSKIQILVSPDCVSKFLEEINNAGMQYEALEHHMDAGPKMKYNWSQYHTLNETYDWLRSLSETFPEASLFVAGKSYEGRDLLGLKISYNDDEQKKAIFLEGGMHAREWISPATVTFIIYQLLTNPEKDVRTIAENFDWYILPHSNPDGYVYSHTTDRLWRKTRSPQANGCYGVDLNRNWDFHWNETGASSDPCNENFAGPQPFSEIEALTLANFIFKLKNKLFMYISYHSNRQMLLYPFGYSSELPENIADLRRVHHAGVVGLSRLYGSKYSIQFNSIQFNSISIYSEE